MSDPTSGPAATSRNPASALSARLGVAVEEGTEALALLGALDEEGPTPQAGPLVDELARAPNPAIALRGVVRLVETHGLEAVARPERPWAEMAGRVAVVAGTSDALVDLLATHPEGLDLLAGDLNAAPAGRIHERATQALAEVASDATRTNDHDAVEERARALTVVQRLGLLRVAARDLLGRTDTPGAAAELADLASGLLAAALDDLTAHEPVRMAVIGMGKLGGRELNYVSDVDVMFVHEGDDEAAARVARSFLHLLGHRTPDGSAYEVDANLRPEGRDGPLSRTLEAYEAYYERWAHTWEYQALLKARPVAGDDELGRRFMALAEPYVWPDSRAGQSVTDIQRMKTSVETGAAVRKAGAREVKLAPGGIRDIEFAVQLLQLVHGRHDPSLRSARTLDALAALAEGGYIDDGDANLFNDAYQFLRTVEHRLQLRGLRRTHVIPSDDARRTRLARACGFRDIRVASAVEQFDKEYARVQGYVRRLHEKLFYRPLLSRFAELSAADRFDLDGAAQPAAEDTAPAGTQGKPGAAGELGPAAARERLDALGFADPERALRDLEYLGGGVSRSARLLRTLLPALLPTLAASPDPDGGLAAFRTLTERLSRTPEYLRTLRDNPPVGDVLARVLGQSAIVGGWLARQPELLPHLDDEEVPTDEDYHRLADGLLRRNDSSDRTTEALRRLKRREVARLAVNDLVGRLTVDEVGRRLSAMAEATLDAGLRLATQELPMSFAVLGMGKLGGRELGYTSDLDVVLVFEPAERRDEALRAADELVRALSNITGEGQAFLVDLGLRPEGRDGPVARTLDSTVTYYQQWADAWELQAMTQARHVAGDPTITEQLLESLGPLVYTEAPDRRREQQIRQMKARIERERAGGRRGLGVRRGDRVDLKVGPGGLADVDWTVQLLQLRHGGQAPELRVPGTLAALAALEEAGHLDERDASWLRDGWRLLARLRNALYLAGHRHTSLLPTGPGHLDHVAQMLGFEAPGGQALTEDLGRAMRRVRKVHERRFYEA